jgi:hypothetical protein
MAHWMRPELPQGFDDREVGDLMDKVAHQHWSRMPQYGLPQDPRSRALRTFGRFLARKLCNGRLASDDREPPIAPFAATVGHLKHYREFDRVLDQIDTL